MKLIEIVRSYKELIAVLVIGGLLFAVGKNLKTKQNNEEQTATTLVRPSSSPAVEKNSATSGSSQTKASQYEPSKIPAPDVTGNALKQFLTDHRMQLELPPVFSFRSVAVNGGRTSMLVGTAFGGSILLGIHVYDQISSRDQAFQEMLSALRISKEEVKSLPLELKKANGLIDPELFEIDSNGLTSLVVLGKNAYKQNQYVALGVGFRVYNQTRENFANAIYSKFKILP
ncbi:MAG: hypothetical protein COT73_05915 [Bdellovibrio sp. CG10_big_fil_rev_8_21_14_0_10_47_8]|nr:MAG: hypothetical protein COT73_05915 [Bdellovibrio sp. CG10_big_fil_rev_8_21_14_0_10_47_8]